MSVLQHVRGIILSHMTGTPELKEAVMDVVDNVDNDLDKNGYEDVMSDETDEAINKLNKVLIGSDTAAENESESDVVIKRESMLDDDETESSS